MQRYRSGHNEAVLKTVCPQGRVGSNPTLCVLASWLSWLERRPVTAEVEGSSPSGVVYQFYIFMGS